jgi:transcriptional regulator with XRE-family HTH domain
VRTLQNRIKELREQKGIKQIDLAEYLNVSQATLSNWERNVFNPDKESLISIADYFGTTTDYILGRADSINTADINTQNANSPKGTKDLQMINPLPDGFSPEESELCRIYRLLGVKQRHKLMSVAFALETSSEMKEKEE